MKVKKEVKLEMTEEEKKAVKTVYRMLYDLDENDDRAVANELYYDDLESIMTDLSRLYELSGECEADLH